MGSSLINKNYFNKDTLSEMNFIGIFSKNRAEWSIVDAAAIFFKLTTIPIYDTLGDENITYVLKHTSLKTLFVNDTAIKALKKTSDLDKLEVLISYDPIDAESLEYFSQKGIQLLSYQEVLESGKASLVDYNQEQFKTEPNDCLTFSYTSGTTGPPKGAMISHKNFTAFIGSVIANKDTNFCEKDTALSYLPLPHILEREFLFSCFAVGAKIIYYSGDVAKLKDDLALAKPTIFVSVPRLFSRFHDVIQGKFK